MTSLLDGLIDPRLIPVVMWLIIGVIALIVVYTAFRIVRMLTSGTYIAGGRNRRTRLAVLDAAAVDDRRRLVLVRRDDVEHLILIGGPTDVVVEQDIRIGVRPTRAAPAEPEHALDAYDHGDEALQPHPVPPSQPRQLNRPAERQPAQRVPAPPRPAHVEPAPPAPAPQPIAVRPVAPVAPMPQRQPIAQVVQQAPAPAAPQQRTIRPVMPRVTLPAATQPNFVQPVEEHRDPPMSARVTPHPARAQANRRQQPQPQPQPAPMPVENDLDDALLQELETSLRYPARERSRAKAADIDDEMNKLLGEMSRDRR
ncbi:MAG: hypothetical protein ACK4U0_18635 [Mesorhizobium sp.]